MGMKELEKAIRQENIDGAWLELERITKKAVPRGAFPFEKGDQIYLRCPEWHYVGKVTKVDVNARWVEMFPVVHILETDNAKSFYTNGLRNNSEGGQDRYEVSPVPLVVQLEGWSATYYPHPVPEVDYIEEVPAYKGVKHPKK
jgi:hypothetical protein